MLLHSDFVEEGESGRAKSRLDAASWRIGMIRRRHQTVEQPDRYLHIGHVETGRAGELAIASRPVAADRRGIDRYVAVACQKTAPLGYGRESDRNYSEVIFSIVFCTTPWMRYSCFSSPGEPCDGCDPCRGD